MTNHAYRIGHRRSGHDFGVFIATSPETALDVMAVQAGYNSHADIPDEQRASDDDLIVENVDGTVHDLTHQLITAAEKFRKEKDAEAVPDVLYVKLYRDCGWMVHFSETPDSETEMTRWSTGEDIAELYAAITAVNRDAVFDYAGSMIGGWEDEWTDD